MKREPNGFYFGGIKIKIKCSGIFSEKADVCIIPQHSHGIELKGLSARIAHSPARSSIIAFQNYLSKAKTLPLGEVFTTPCEDEHYSYLMQISVLDCPVDKISQIISTAIQKAMQEAERLGAKTLIIPEINCALLPKTAIMSEIKKHAKRGHSIRQVTLLCNNERSCYEYAQIAFDLLNN